MIKRIRVEVTGTDADDVKRQLDQVTEALADFDLTRGKIQTSETRLDGTLTGASGYLVLDGPKPRR